MEGPHSYLLSLSLFPDFPMDGVIMRTRDSDAARGTIHRRCPELVTHTYYLRETQGQVHLATAIASQ